MKKSPLFRVITVLIVIIPLSFIYSCSNDDDVNSSNENEAITEVQDELALLFMLEEEKLARDTYTYLNGLWSANQFSSIKSSEQNHMNKIENLLIKNNIAYSILTAGEFANQDLQNLYDQFIIDGAVSKANALQIGATIEDLDIVDLQDYIDQTSNATLKSVFKSLKCGSRNHLRSFVSGIENEGGTYIPQFLTQDDYDVIIAGSQEQCN